MLVVAVLVLAVLGLLAPAAEATFPGRNGDLLVTDRYIPHGPDRASYLWRIDRRSGKVTWISICEAVPFSPAPQPMCFWAGPPAVSPDGTSVAFTAEDKLGEYPQQYPAAGIRVLSLVTGQWAHVPLPPLTLREGVAMRWTPDGSLVVVTDRKQALLLNHDGTTPREIISNVTALDVSIDGDVAFIRRAALRVRNDDGSSRRITGRGASRPSWSPHGKSIAYTYKRSIYTVPAEGGRPTRLTRGFNPVWSPDGRQIAFFRTHPPDVRYLIEGTTYLYVLNRQTGRVRRVSSHPMLLKDSYDDATAGLDWQPAR
jgi:WD40-like Beta Propeller Repeat